MSLYRLEGITFRFVDSNQMRERAGSENPYGLIKNGKLGTDDERKGCLTRRNEVKSGGLLKRRRLQVSGRENTDNAGRGSPVSAVGLDQAEARRMRRQEWQLYVAITSPVGNTAGVCGNESSRVRRKRAAAVKLLTRTSDLERVCGKLCVGPFYTALNRGCPFRGSRAPDSNADE